MGSGPGFFSLDRWGPGSIAILFITVTFGIIVLITGKGRPFPDAISAFVFALAAVLVLVKRAENITPADAS